MPESTGTSPRRIGAAIFLGLLFLGIAVVSPYVFDLAVSTSPDPPVESLASQIGAQPTAGQQIPAQVALKQIQARDKLLRESYGWVDRGQSIVRVPLGRAREFVLKKGLPSR